MVGSSGTFPAPGRPSSGYVIEHSGTRVWCEAGPGTFTSLPVASELIDAVVVSHRHPDHCSDLMTAYHAWTYGVEPREPVPLYAPKSVWNSIINFLSKEPSCFDFQPVESGDEVSIGPIGVAFTEADHSVPTVGSRWEADNRTLYFTADTGPGKDWTRLADGVDSLLSEASYQGASEEKQYDHHLTASEAAGIARNLGVGSLTLTHIPPYLDPTVSIAEAESIFDRPVRLAVPGTNFDV